MLHSDCIQMLGTYDFGIKLMNQYQNSVLCYYLQVVVSGRTNPDCITVLRQWDGAVSIADIKIGEKATKISIQSEKIVTFFVFIQPLYSLKSRSLAPMYT